MTASTSVEACGYCQGVLDANSTVAQCSTCGIKQHRECWDEYGGCVLPGCTGQDNNRPIPEQQPAQPVQILVPEGGAPVTAAPPVAMQQAVPTSGKSIAVLVVAALILLAALIAAGVLLAMN